MQLPARRVDGVKQARIQPAMEALDRNEPLLKKNLRNAAGVILKKYVLEASPTVVRRGCLTRRSNTYLKDNVEGNRKPLPALKRIPI